MIQSGNDYLTPRELAERWRNVISLSTLDNWRSQQRGPRWFKAGGRVLYPIHEVLQFEERNMRGFPNSLNRER